MEKPPKYAPLFPEDFKSLNEQYGQMLKRLNAIDYELENSPKDLAPTPHFRPSGPESYDTSVRERRTKFLDGMREKVVENYRSSIENQISSLPYQEQNTIFSRYDYETSKNGFKAYTKENLKEVNDITKDDDVSMDYMAAKHFSKYHLPDKSVADEKENIDAWSVRYLTLLDTPGATKHGYGTDKDDIELDKDLL